MRKLSQQALQQLVQETPRSPAVTLYIPTHISSSPPHITEDQIRFKNLCSQALDILSSQESASDFIKEFEQFRDQMLGDIEFWKHLTASVLICARPGSISYFHLPVDSEEYVAVDDHFHLTPIFGVLHDMRDFYILSLGKHDTALYRGDMYGLEASGITLPAHAGAAAAMHQAEDGIHHKDRVDNETPTTLATHDDKHRFFKLIDDKICQAAQTDLPLIVASIDGEVAEYQSISRYPHLVTRSIAGYYTEGQLHELHEKAMDIMREDILSEEHRMIIDDYNRLAAQPKERTAETMAELKAAAEQGKIQTLLVAMRAKTRDTVRDTREAVHKLVFPGEPSQSQAVDYIAQQVMHQSGRVINLTADEMPHGKLVLAINRY